ncbi:hypothetical protein [Bacillus thermotolerans]|uniref:hypothetical protein n=1 Tax=Bacillus thermotolerans TaxID=1221996 RepID=UPI000582F69F|nr:hypothetical protein [Bacillus thermotolerans]KKB36616.1 hypothetical protein QY97_00788 [Bacillus thermotolerans]
MRILGSLFLLSGAALLWTSGAGWQHYILSFGPMLDLLTMFTLIPILGIPIKLGQYSESIQTLIERKVKTSGHLYILTSGISYFFSIFMNLATLPMTYYSIRPALHVFAIPHEERFMSRAITRGFAMPLTWAPVTPIVGIVIVMTGVSWSSVLPYLIPLSIFGLLTDWFLGSRKAKRLPARQNAISMQEMAVAAESNALSRPGRIAHILIAILLFNVAISIIEVQLPYSFLILVSLLVIPFAFSWALLLKKGKAFGTQLSSHFQSVADSMKDQFFIFLSAGFFISTINVSHANDWLYAVITNVIDTISVEIFLILLPLIPLAFAFLGFHPAVTLALMAEALNPSAIGISPVILTVAMLAGAVSAFLVGPYNATIGLMSNIAKESSYKISNWNLGFTCLYIGFVMMYLFLLELFIA